MIQSRPQYFRAHCSEMDKNKNEYIMSKLRCSHRIITKRILHRHSNNKTSWEEKEGGPTLVCMTFLPMKNKLFEFYKKKIKKIRWKKGGTVNCLLNDLQHDLCFYITDYNSLLIGWINKIILKRLPHGVITKRKQLHLYSNLLAQPNTNSNCVD